MDGVRSMKSERLFIDLRNDGINCATFSPTIPDPEPTIAPLRFMTAHRLLALLAAVSFPVAFCHAGVAGDPSPPLINTITATNGQKRIQWTPYPGAQRYQIFSADDLSQPWVQDTAGSVSGFDWSAPLAGGRGFHRLQVTPLTSGDLLVANVLNRLAYGPTPDELERVRAIGPENYIQEQLAPESINESLAIDVVDHRPRRGRLPCPHACRRSSRGPGW